MPDPAKLPPRAGLAEYRRMLDRLGLARAVVVQPDNYGFDNAALLAAVAGLGGRARGVASIAADATDRELERLHAGGVRGVRVSNRSRYCRPLDELETVAARIAGLGWHVGLLVDPEELPGLARRLDRVAADVVIDHFGRCPAERGPGDPGFRALLDIARHPRAWVKLSAPEALSRRPPRYDDMAPLAEALIEAGTARLLWGTDWPHGSVTFNGLPMPNDGDLLDGLGRWLPDPAARAAVLARNPARLYGFPDATP